jgi:hypothetical protein
MPWHGLSSKRLAPLSALALYLLASVLWFGLPVLADFSSSVIGVGGVDQSVSIWALKWWPHALSEGINPFQADVIYSPDGFNLAWAAGIPAASALAAPVTAIFGPVAAYNAWAIVAPALAGGAAFCLCRLLTEQFWPSLAGGYLFGFSSYMLAVTLGHLNLAVVAATVPLAVYLFLRHLDRSLSDAKFATLLAGCLVFQFLTFTETFATMVGFAAATLGAIWIVYPGRRRALWDTVRVTALAYVLTALLVSPYLFYAFSEPETLAGVNPPEQFSTDPLNLVIPTQITALGGDAFASLSSDFTGNASEQYAYLALPTLVILAWLLIDRRSRGQAKLLLAIAGAAALASFGPYLHLGNLSTDIPLPWWPLTHAPLLKFALPARMMLYAWLAVSVAVAIWLASARKAGLRAVVAVLIVASLAPNLGGSFPGTQLPRWHADMSTPAFFRDADYRRFVEHDEAMLVLPYGPHGLSMLWQAETDMDFRMVGGYISSSAPPEYRCWPINLLLQFGIPVPDPARELLAFLRAKEATVAVTPVGMPDPLRAVLGADGVRPQVSGGMRIYPVPGGAPESRRPTCPPTA